MSEQELVWGLIELLINYHAQGLKVLLGLAKPPRVREVYEMMNAVRGCSLNLGECCKSGHGDGMSKVERIIDDNARFNAIAELAGGWGNIIQACRANAEHDLSSWLITADYIKHLGTLSVRHTSRMGLLAAKYKLSPKEILKRRKNFSKNLANEILRARRDFVNDRQ